MLSRFLGKTALLAVLAMAVTNPAQASWFHKNNHPQQQKQHKHKPKKAKVHKSGYIPHDNGFHKPAY